MYILNNEYRPDINIFSINSLLRNDNNISKGITYISTCNCYAPRKNLPYLDYYVTSKTCINLFIQIQNMISMDHEVKYYT